VTPEETRALVAQYRDMGCNMLRVWGGGYLESREFYEACDEAGLMVWQEFPLSSSGLDSEPPHDPGVITGLAGVAEHFVRARRHHASLLLWCGGNELQTGAEGCDPATRVPCDKSDPCLAALGAVVAAEDPGRRYLPTSPSGPRFGARAEDFGKGLHHHVHGPWGFGDFPTYRDWVEYWNYDDSTFRSEVGVAGANSVEMIHKYSGGEAVWPPTSPLWMHTAGWWTQESRLLPALEGLAPAEALAEYVRLTQEEQAVALAHAAACCKRRFPACGGFLVWMGHDCFPCPSNTSLIDYDGQPKPAYEALRRVFLQPPGESTDPT
jgi:beta-mannosidase